MNDLDLSPEQFQQLVQRVQSIAVEYLKDLPDRPIPAAGSGLEVRELFRRPLPEQGSAEEALAGLQETVRYCRAQNGRFFGYVLGSGIPAGAAADLLCSVLNQNVTAWRSSPAGVTVEQEVVSWLAHAIGCAGFSGILTGGGSSANLMALALAREAKLPANECGTRGTPAHAVYASAEAHMSIAKAVALLGIGRDNLRAIPVDESFRMITRELEKAVARDRQRDITPLAVVATSGTVNTGALDTLPEIAEIARGCGAWLHVDGSYGALAAIAEPEKFSGLPLADSVALDPHKWLYQPLDCGCLLFRNVQAARTAFAHSGEYVRALSADPVEGYAFFEESMELSRRFRALKLWFSLRYHGMAAFREAIRRDLEHARQLGARIERMPQLRLMAPIELSAVCFRYVNAQGADANGDAVNLEILKRVNQRGRVYLSNAVLHGKFCLRACIVNHRTTDADVAEVVSEVLAAAAEVSDAPQAAGEV